MNRFPTPIGEVARELYDVLMIRLYKAVEGQLEFALTIDGSGWLWVENPSAVRTEFLIGVFDTKDETKADVRAEIKAEAIRLGLRRGPSPPKRVHGSSKKVAVVRPRVE
ncbi:hypothetical protein CPT_Sonora_098 [Stenotrophomonas phage Sonora]|nr:hypothetical protein CPT_Sonora_098 [Stenotrophomonas phage Sonora]